MRPIIALAAALLALPLSAAASTAYQVTGTVLEVKPGEIIVQKNDEKWSIAVSDATTYAGKPVAVGQKVTVRYTMTARSVEVREGASDASAPPDKGPTVGGVVKETGQVAGRAVQKTGNVTGKAVDLTGRAVGGAINAAGTAVERTAEKVTHPTEKR